MYRLVYVYSNFMLRLLWKNVLVYIKCLSIIIIIDPCKALTLLDCFLVTNSQPIIYQTHYEYPLVSLCSCSKPTPLILCIALFLVIFNLYSYFSSISVCI